jgi:hypothetical protein
MELLDLAKQQAACKDCIVTLQRFETTKHPTYNAECEKYRKALEEIKSMKITTGYRYAFNSCWHLADKALKSSTVTDTQAQLGEQC